MTIRHARRDRMPECIGRVVEVQYLLGFAGGSGACAAEPPQLVKLIVLRKAEDRPEEEITSRSIEHLSKLDDHLDHGDLWPSIL